MRSEHLGLPWLSLGKSPPLMAVFIHAFKQYVLAQVLTNRGCQVQEPADLGHVLPLQRKAQKMTSIIKADDVLLEAPLQVRLVAEAGKHVIHDLQHITTISKLAIRSLSIQLMVLHQTKSKDLRC